MAQVNVDWDFIESKWNSIEKTMPEARRAALSKSTASKTNSKKSTISSKGKPSSKQSLSAAYSTPINININPASISGKPRRKRPAFATQTLEGGNDSTRSKLNDSLPQITNAGRTGTPLKLADFDEITPRSPQPRSRRRLAEELSTQDTPTRKQLRNSTGPSAQGLTPLHNPDQSERFDSSTFIEKKMMLPYLDKFLYIGSKIDSMTADLADENAREQALRIHNERLAAQDEGEAESGGLTWRSEGGSPRSQHPETDSARRGSSSKREQLSSRNTPRSARQMVGQDDDDDDDSLPDDADDNMFASSLKGEEDMYFHRSGGEGVQLKQSDDISIPNDTLYIKTATQQETHTKRKTNRSQLEIKDSSVKINHVVEEERKKRFKSSRIAEQHTFESEQNDKATSKTFKHKTGRTTVGGGAIPVPSGGKVIAEARYSLRIDNKVLSSRYVRFWETANLDKIVNTSNYSMEAPKIRSLPWLLQVIEDIYDAAKNVEQSVTVDTGGKHMKKETVKAKQAREDLEKRFLHYDGQSVLRSHTKPKEEESLGPGETFAAGVTSGGERGTGSNVDIPPLPSFVFSFFERRHGVKDMVRKSCIELLLTLEEVRRISDEARDNSRKKAAFKAAMKNSASEANSSGSGSLNSHSTLNGETNGYEEEEDAVEMEPVLEAELFSNFLRELYTADHFCFFLHARHVTQTLFGIRLSSLKSRVLSDGAAGSLEATANSRRVAGVGRDLMADPNHDLTSAAAGSGGLFRRPGDLFLRPHPATQRDGTLQPCLSPQALQMVAKTLVSQGMAAGADVASGGVMKVQHDVGSEGSTTLAQRNARDSRIIAEFVVQVLLQRFGHMGKFVDMNQNNEESYLFDEFENPNKPTRFKHGDVTTQTAKSAIKKRFVSKTNGAAVSQNFGFPQSREVKEALPVQNWLSCLVEVLRSAPDEVVREGKDGVETLGGKMLMIEKMQETITDGELVEDLMQQILQAEHEAAKCALVLETDQRRFQVVSLLISNGQNGGDQSNLLQHAEEQGKLRSRIVLGKAEVGRTKANVIELKKQKHAIEIRKEAVWAEIMGMDGNGNAGAKARKSRKRTRVDLKADKLLASMSQRAKGAVRCFTLWSGRQGKRHEAAKEAAASLVGAAWKKDLDKLKERAVLKIQRLYRDRKNKRLAAKARAVEAARRESLRRQAEEEAFEASVAVRASHAAAAERQLARSRAVLAARAKTGEDALDRAAVTKRGVANFEVERRWRRYELRLKRDVFRCWSLERATTIHAHRCFLSAVRRMLKSWHEETAYNLKLFHAATKIQGMWRQREAWERVANLRLMMYDRNAKTSLLLTRIKRRFELYVLQAWRLAAVQSIQSRKMAERIWGNIRKIRFDRWRRYVIVSHNEKHKASLLISAVLRGRIHRKRTKLEALRYHSACKIQSWMRGILANFEVFEMKERMQKLNGQVALLIGGKHKNLKKLCFTSWYRGCIIEKRVNLAARKMNHRLLNLALSEWYRVVHKIRLRRLEEKAQKAEAALCIQSWIRGIWARAPFLELLRTVRAAKLVQRGWRGRMARVILQYMYYRKLCAIKIQSVFRGYQARAHQVGVRLADVLRAAEDNDYDRLMWYMDTFGNEVALETDKDGNTALHWAAIGGGRRCLKLCLARGGDPNGYNSKGLTPLHCAISSNAATRDEVAAYLMDHGAYIESPDYEGNTPILLAAKLGRAAICGQLIDREADMFMKDFDGANPLQAACARGHVGVVQTLLDHGAAIDEAGIDGVTPLHEAVGRGDKEVVMCLLEMGCLTDIQDDDGFTALMYAATNDLGDMASALLSFGASVDGRDAEGRTALHIAAEKGAVSVVTELLLADADLMAADGDGDTALHVAVRAAAQREAESKLKSKEADKKEKEALEAGYAASATEFEVAKEARKIVAVGDARRAKTAVLTAHAARETRYTRGAGPAYVPPVSLAETLSDVEVVDEALEELKPRDRSGWLKLSEDRKVAVAAREFALEMRDSADAAVEEAEKAEKAVDRSLELMEKLLATGADLKAQNEDGDQPAHLASRLGHVASMALMVKYEAPLGRRNWAELTPVGVARMHGQLQVIQFLLDNMAPEALGIVEPSDEPIIDLPPPPVAWDLPIIELSDGWEEAWDTENQTTYFVNKKTGEMSKTAPQLSAEEVMKLRDRRQERLFKSKVKMEFGKSLVGTQEYREFVANEKAGAERLREMQRSAVLMQSYWRRRAARKQVRWMRGRRDAARRIQRMVRNFQYRKRQGIDSVLAGGAVGFQRLWRGMVSRQYYEEVLYADLWWHRHRRYFALLVQRLWAGFIFRRKVRRLKVMNMMGRKLRHEEWVRLIGESRRAFEDDLGPIAPLRSFRMYDEYRLKGTLDVNFYVHRITSAGTWDQPQAWVEDDHRIRSELAEMLKLGYTVAERDAAIKFQRMWRMRVVRVAFKNVMKGQRLMRGGEIGYLQDPNSPVAVANFALFKHVFMNDYDHARLLYARCMEMMTTRGPDNCFVLLSYSVFLAVTQEDDWDTIQLLAARGRKANFHNKYDRRADRYNLAKAGFYRLATVMSRRQGEAWHNYALCLYLGFQDLKGAQAAFIQAVLGSPGDEKVMDNFDYFLRTARPELVADGYDAFELVRMHCVEEAAAKDAAKLARLKQLDSVECHHAATVIQLHFRAMKLRSLFEGKTAKELSTKPVKEVKEDSKIEDRIQLVEKGLAYWLWEQIEGEGGRPYWYNNETGESTWEPPEDQYEILVAQDVESNGLVFSDGDAGGGVDAILPSDLEEWEVCADGQGRTFYYNSTTGESQWEQPLQPQQVDSGEGNEWGAYSELGSPAVWEECFDDNGRVFYYNVETGESSWQDPRNLLMPDSTQYRDTKSHTMNQDTTLAIKDQSEGDGYLLGGEDSEAIITNELAEQWETAEDDEGYVFYYNNETGESTYDRPDGSGRKAELTSLDVVQKPPSPTHSEHEEIEDYASFYSPFGDWEYVEDVEGSYWYNNATGESSWEKPEY